jgi:hypothetical protein
MNVLDGGYSRLSNLLTMSVLDGGYSRLSNLLTMNVLDGGYDWKAWNILQVPLIVRSLESLEKPPSSNYHSQKIGKPGITSIKYR